MTLKKNTICITDKCIFGKQCEKGRNRASSSYARGLILSNIWSTGSYRSFFFSICWLKLIALMPRLRHFGLIQSHGVIRQDGNISILILEWSSTFLGTRDFNWFSYSAQICYGSSIYLTWVQWVEEIFGLFYSESQSM